MNSEGDAPPGGPSGAELKAAARAMIRNLRETNFGVWYAHLGPYQALKLQEQHAKEIAPQTGEASEGAASADDAAPTKEEDSIVKQGFIRNEDGSVQRLKIPEKDVRMKAILYLSRFQRYLEDLPPRQVTPPKCNAVGMPRNTTIGRLEDALNEGLVDPENTAAVLLQVGRLRDFVGDNGLCRKRLKRLITREVSLPMQRLEAHRICVSSLLRSGGDADAHATGAAAALEHHVLAWLELTSSEARRHTLRECTHWLRDRLHMDRFRMQLLEEWAELELKSDAERLSSGLVQPPNAEVFIELAFHCIRQERFDEALKWVSLVIELCPGVVEALDKVLHTRTAVSELPPALGGLTGHPNAALFEALFYKGHLLKRKTKPTASTAIRRSQTAPSGVRDSSDDTTAAAARKREAIARALAAKASFVPPGPGHYDSVRVDVASTHKAAPVVSFGAKLVEGGSAKHTGSTPGPAHYDTAKDLGEDAPAAVFQSRTLFGSVYASEVRHRLGLPAPTSYNPDSQYSHARARWRATEEARRIASKLEPELTEAKGFTSHQLTAPTQLRHIDYAVNPRFAPSVVVPPERIAPAQVGRPPVPPLPDDANLGGVDMMQGRYTGYSVASTIAPGKAVQRLAAAAATAGASQTGGGGGFVGYIPPLGGGLLGGGGGGGGSFGASAPSLLSTVGSTLSHSAKPSSPSLRAPSPARHRPRRAHPHLDGVIKEASVTGYVPAPRVVFPGGAFTASDRWQEARAQLERAAEVPGPMYSLPSLNTGPSYTMQSGFNKEVLGESAATSDGGGPGVCRSDSAFGKQVSSYQRSAPSATFDSRATSTSFAPIMNLKSMQAQDDTHDHVHATDSQAGMRATMMSAFDPRGLPGVGTYAMEATSMAAISAAKYSQHTQALSLARQAMTRRQYG